MSAERHIRGQNCELLQRRSDAALCISDPGVAIRIFAEMAFLTFVKHYERERLGIATSRVLHGLAKGVGMNAALDGQGHVFVGKANHLPTIERQTIVKPEVTDDCR